MVLRGRSLEIPPPNAVPQETEPARRGRPAPGTAQYSWNGGKGAIGGVTRSEKEMSFQIAKIIHKTKT